MVDQGQEPPQVKSKDQGQEPEQNLPKPVPLKSPESFHGIGEYEEELYYGCCVYHEHRAS